MNGVMWVVLFDCSCGSSTKMPRMGSLLSPPSRASPVMAGFTKVCGLRPLPVLSVVLLSPPSRASPVMVVFVNVCGLRPLPVLSVVLLSPPSRASPVMAGFPKVCGLRPLPASSDACSSAAVGVGAGITSRRRHRRHRSCRRRSCRRRIRLPIRIRCRLRAG